MHLEHPLLLCVVVAQVAAVDLLACHVEEHLLLVAEGVGVLVALARGAQDGGAGGSERGIKVYYKINNFEYGTISLQIMSL